MRRVLVPVVAASVVALAVGSAIALPMYTCMDPYEFEELPGPGGGPTCSVSDTGYRPRSWLPTKITIAGAGIVSAIAIVLWARRRRFVAIGLIVAFVGLAALWFVRTG
jgi:hypothetical protein